jgi:hypothetical protein
VIIIFLSLIFNLVFFSSGISMLSSSNRIEPEHQIEQCNLALCVISEQGELRPREAPIVVNHLKGDFTVFVTFVALVEEVVERFTTPLSTRRSTDSATGNQALCAQQWPL